MRTFLLLAIVTISFIAGALGARSALSHTVHFSPTAQNVIATDIPPRAYAAACTLVQTDTHAHTLLVDMPDPYNRSQKVRVLIAYDEKTDFRPGLTVAGAPMSDNIAASLMPGDRLLISIGRTDGPLRALAIYFPRLRDLLSSNS